VGSLGVEMFLTWTGEIVSNQLAPRAHNSGHYTIEACVCSQLAEKVFQVVTSQRPLFPKGLRRLNGPFRPAVLTS
jgi:phosphoribosylaminoimidazole carboxylase (NCAIR synthetase)